METSHQTETYKSLIQISLGVAFINIQLIDGRCRIRSGGAKAPLKPLVYRIGAGRQDGVDRALPGIIVDSDGLRLDHILLQIARFGALDARITLRLALPGLSRVLLAWLVLAGLSRRVVSGIRMTGIFLALVARQIWILLRRVRRLLILFHDVSP